AFGTGVLQGEGTDTLVVNPYCFDMTVTGLPDGGAWQFPGAYPQPFLTTTVAFLPGTYGLSVIVPAQGTTTTTTGQFTVGANGSAPPVTIGTTTFAFSSPCQGPMPRVLSSLGNSFPGHPNLFGGINAFAMPVSVTTMLALADGTVLALQPIYEEAGRFLTVLRDGQIVGYGNGDRVGVPTGPLAANARYVYLSMLVKDNGPAEIGFAPPGRN